MTRAGPWDNEAEGANLIARLIDGRLNPRDVPGAPPGTHDFDIQLAVTEAPLPSRYLTRSSGEGGVRIDER